MVPDPNLLWVLVAGIVVAGEWFARHRDDRLQFLTYWIRRLLPVPVRVALWVILGLHFIPLPICDGYCL